MSVKVEIVLSTFNGEQFLGELLESCLAQTFSDWRMLIRDDGSTDGTRGIIQSHVNKYPEKFVWIIDEKGNLGPKDSFGLLLSRTVSPYVMCCDQDDVWHADKIALSVQEMATLERHHPLQPPLLVFCDAALVDEALKTIAASFVAHCGFNVSRDTQFGFLVLGNIIPGCTMMVNRKLVEMALPFPSRAFMHDWWLALIAAGYGEIGHIPRPLLLYRQHGQNLCGLEKKASVLKYLLSLAHDCGILFRSQQIVTDQIGVFYERFCDYMHETFLSPKKRREMRNVFGIFIPGATNPWKRRWLLLKFFLVYPCATRSLVGIYSLW
jgi:glycosyltransferase involved in cell wall biosynthesis